MLFYPLYQKREKHAINFWFISLQCGSGTLENNLPCLLTGGVGAAAAISPQFQPFFHRPACGLIPLCFNLIINSTQFDISPPLHKMYTSLGFLSYVFHILTCNFLIAWRVIWCWDLSIRWKHSAHDLQQHVFNIAPFPGNNDGGMHLHNLVNTNKNN